MHNEPDDFHDGAKEVREPQDDNEQETPDGEMDSAAALVVCAIGLGVAYLLLTGKFQPEAFK